MFELKKPEICDKAWVDELLARSDFRCCEYTFGNMFTWQNIYDITIGRYKDFLIERNSGGFFFPAGNGDIADAISAMRSYCTENGKKLYLSRVDKASKELLIRLYGDEIQVEALEDYYDYVYNRSDLDLLGGKKYHSKRNHISRFLENSWTYERITPENIDECRQMNDEWCAENDCINDAEKSEESCSVRRGMKYFTELGFSGGLLRVDGKVIAFTFGERVNSNTFVVHVEKALKSIQGAYTMINNQFVKSLDGGFEYVNREDDAGAENLRRAKRSYYPAFMEEKYKVRFLK